MTYASITMTLFAAAALAGCASTPLRTDSSTAGIRAAQEVGAKDVPRAALHLQLAKEELARARQLAADGEDEKAASMIGRAEADAELAVLLAREDNEKAEANAALDELRKLKAAN